METPALADFSLQPQDNGKIKVKGMTREQLLDLHAKVENELGGLGLMEVNLVKETLLQIHRAKLLQETASQAKDAPLNQKAQVQNSLGSMLTQLAKVQIDLFNSERIKRIQGAVVKVVKTLPKPQQDQFFEMLQDELSRAARETDDVEVIGAVR